MGGAGIDIEPFKGGGKGGNKPFPGFLRGIGIEKNADRFVLHRG